LLRVNDLGPGVVTVDEAFKIAETGSDRIGEPKTEESGKPAPIPRDLERELRQYIREQGLADADLIWGTAAGTPIHPHNYLTRTLQPIAAAAGVKGFTYQAARRTCATHFGDTKVAQRQLRHSNPNTTRKHYEQVIPEEHRKRIEEVDAAMRKPKAKVTPIRKRA
jgi:integrase